MGIYTYSGLNKTNLLNPNLEFYGEGEKLEG